MNRLPRRTIMLDTAFDDLESIERLIETLAPYWPVQRYFSNEAEYGALSGAQPVEAMVVAPIFRGNWATDGQASADVQPLLRHQPFLDAARRLFNAEVVRPQNVYVNLTWQLPFPQGMGHTDVPAFRGFDRCRYPISFLSIMGHSGLFEDVRVQIATAVAWLHRGHDGGFEYWPDGPDQPSAVHEGDIHNTAIVGDNDFMWHRVRPTGRIEDGMLSLTLHSELVRDGDAWRIVDHEQSLASFTRSQLRVSVSWKAIVFESDRERRRHDDHTDDIGLDEVLRRFARDLERRNIPFELPEDPLRDPTFIRLLTETYVRSPSTFAPAQP